VRRDENLDTVRGIACILLVLYHVVGVNTDSGLRLDPNDPYRVVNEVLGFLRMPLFTFLSGIVYALRPVEHGRARIFASGKLKRLLLPFIFVSLIFATVQKLTPGTNMKLEWAEIPLVVIWPYAHLWFIAALLLVFSLVSVLDYLHALQKPVGIIALFLAACALFELRHGMPGILGWNRAFYLLPFFVGGLALKRFGWRCAVLCALLALILRNWGIPLGLILGVGMLAVIPAISGLAWIGRYSYSVYLYHVFGTAASRIVWERADMSNVHLLVISGALCGIFVPIVIHLALQRIPYASRALLGVRHEKAHRATVEVQTARANGR
jgi:peptidoglycan/LPS O-acetylase OafA/YrhL